MCSLLILLKVSQGLQQKEETTKEVELLQVGSAYAGDRVRPSSLPWINQWIEME